MKKLFLLFFLLSAIVCYAQNGLDKIVVSENLEITPLSSHVFIHTSQTEFEGFGMVSSNGLIYINGNEAVVIDTPPNDALAEELLTWMAETHPQVKVKAVVPTHFHDDCLGGLKVFHSKGIPSYAYQLTPTLIQEENVALPQNTFNKKLKLKVGEGSVVCEYFGEGHAKDNIVVWIPDEKVLFGGCLIKTLNAGEGNLSDANVAAWPETVLKVKNKYKSVKTVVPGHGSYGNSDLLEYTIHLFTKNE